MLYFKYK